MPSCQHAPTHWLRSRRPSVLVLMFFLFWPDIVTMVQAQTTGADEAMNDGSDLLPPATVTRVGEVLRGVFGNRYEEDANPFISRYANDVSLDSQELR